MNFTSIIIGNSIYEFWFFLFTIFEDEILVFTHYHKNKHIQSKFLFFFIYVFRIKKTSTGNSPRLKLSRVPTCLGIYRWVREQSRISTEFFISQFGQYVETRCKEHDNRTQYTKTKRNFLSTEIRVIVSPLKTRKNEIQRITRPRGFKHCVTEVRRVVCD